MKYLARREPLLAIAAAGAAGGGLRAAISVPWVASGGVAFPWPTLAVNVLGSLLIGLWWGRFGRPGPVSASPDRHAVVMSGFLGGFTTFSAFGAETWLLLTDGRSAEAAAYVGVSFVAWPLAAMLGLGIGRRRASENPR